MGFGSEEPIEEEHEEPRADNGHQKKEQQGTQDELDKSHDHTSFVTEQESDTLSTESGIYRAVCHYNAILNCTQTKVIP